MIEKVIDTTYVKDLYVEYFADNMKELVRAGDPEYLEAHKGDYLRLWVQLGLKYPGVYLKAYIGQTYGYYSPQAVYTVADIEGVTPSDTGITAQPLIHGKAAVKIREILLKLENIFPLYGALWSMASLLWLTLLTLVLTLSKKREPSRGESSDDTPWFVLWVPALAVVCTLLIATPVATEFRYAYHLACTLPLYVAVMLIVRNK
jgi:hypothetical protein